MGECPFVQYAPFRTAAPRAAAPRWHLRWHHFLAGRLNADDGIGIELPPGPALRVQNRSAARSLSSLAPSLASRIWRVASSPTTTSGLNCQRVPVRIVRAPASPRRTQWTVGGAFGITAGRDASLCRSGRVFEARSDHARRALRLAPVAVPLRSDHERPVRRSDPSLCPDTGAARAPFAGRRAASPALLAALCRFGVKRLRPRSRHLRSF